ncbi:MAG: ABC transporter permease subunit [Dehalococcoidia bacterium]|nr:ABC transporter permease subunit [Dehalococcoidia bacterium]
MFGIEIDVAKVVNSIVDFITARLSSSTRAVSSVIETIIEFIVNISLAIPTIVVIIIVGLIIWKVANLKIALGGVISLVLIAFMGLWPEAINTIVLVLMSTTLALGIAIPLGVLMALNDKVSKVLRSILDLMQTMPAFVYLIPVVMFFGIGKVPAVFAIIVFCMPPAIRLTDLGIRGVATEVKEAAISYGATRWELLFDVQFPLAIPTIMAGVSQCIMLSLSMAVIASMIGAAGLGGEVLRGIAGMNIGTGFEAGISIVFLAVLLDRVVAEFTKKSQIKVKK